MSPEPKRAYKKNSSFYRWFFFRSRGDSPFAKIVVHAVLILAVAITLYPALRVLTVSLRPGNRVLSTTLDIIPTERIRVPKGYSYDQLMLDRERSLQEIQTDVDREIKGGLERSNTDAQIEFLFLAISKKQPVADYKTIQELRSAITPTSAKEIQKKLKAQLASLVELPASEVQSSVDRTRTSGRLKTLTVVREFSNTAIDLTVPESWTEETVKPLLYTPGIVETKEFEFIYSKKLASFIVPFGMTQGEAENVLIRKELLYKKELTKQFSKEKITVDMAKLTSFKESKLEDLVYKTPDRLQEEMDAKIQAGVKLEDITIETGHNLKFRVPRSMDINAVVEKIKGLTGSAAPMRGKVELLGYDPVEITVAPDVDVKKLEAVLAETAADQALYEGQVTTASVVILFKDYSKEAPILVKNFPSGFPQEKFDAIFQRLIRENIYTETDERTFARFTTSQGIFETEIPFNLSIEDLRKSFLYEAAGADTISFVTATGNNYINVILEKEFLLWIWNSLLITISTAFLGVALASTSAYAFSRFNFPGRKAGLVFLLSTQMIPAAMLMIPIYIIAIQLDLIGSWRGLVVAYSVGSIPFSVWILKGYYDTIPKELEEAATIDGATKMQTFFQIILPLAAPALAIVFLFNFMQAWNDYLLARIMLNKPETKTWPLGLQQLQGQFATDWGVFAAAAFLVSVPVVILFLGSSKYLISGLTLGSVKG